MADARLGALSDEVLSDGSPARRLGAVSVESVTTTDSTTIQRRLAALSVETMTTSTPPSRRLGSMSVEVLVPVELSFVGWGTPTTQFVWS